jgi:hypothetical protein
MSRMRQLLAVAGVISAGALTITLYEPRQGVTVAELVDAGVMEECSKRTVRCEVLAPDGGYRTVQGTALWCPAQDSAIVPRRTGDALRCQNVGASSDPVDNDLPATSHECACSSGASCNRGDGQPLPIGRIAGGPYRAPYQSFSGAGCVRAPCAEFAGRSSWPNGCQR